MTLDSLPVEFIGTLTAATNEVARPLVKNGPFGTKSVATVTSGTFVGPTINASLAPDVAAGDWLTIHKDGAFSLDVRVSLKTDDGADIFLTYTGIGTRAEDGSMAIRTAPRFETGDERYAWLNTIFTVALGSTTEDGVTYDIYAVR